MGKRSDYRWKARPNGLDGSLYVLDGWPKKRVAWEFLRRTDRYQAICNEIAESRSGDLLNASPLDYGYRIPLKTLVDYSWDWNRAKDTLHFTSRRQIRNRGDRATNDEGKSVVTFGIDLDDVRTNRAVLALRLKMLQREIEKCLEQHSGGEQVAIPYVRHRAEPLGRSLRYLDLEAAGFSAKRIGTLLYGARVSPANRSRMLDKDRKRARQILRNGARDLIVAVLTNPNATIVYTRHAERNSVYEPLEHT